MREISETGQVVPVYHQRPEKPGLYLALFHGRETPREQMDDWGFDGPMIGPLQWCHTTYACHIRICFASHADESRYFAAPAFPDGQDLFIDNDLLKYAGCYYGDWTVFVVSSDELDLPADSFRNANRRNELWRSTHALV